MSELIVEVVTEPDVVVVVPAEAPTAVVQVNVAEPGPPGRDADATAMLAEHIADATPHPAYDNLANGRFITYLRNGMS